LFGKDFLAGIEGLVHVTPLLNKETYSKMDLFPLLEKRPDDKKVIVDIRNAKDWQCSYYFAIKHRDGGRFFFGTIEEMVYHPVFGVQKFVEFYRQIYQWLEVRNRDFIIGQYEEKWSSPFLYWRKVLDWLGHSVSDEELVSAIEETTFENMSKEELSGSGLVRGMRFVLGSEKDPRKRKVREGGVGYYSKYLKAKEVEYIDGLVEERLPKIYGYENIRSI
jgi:hypothetical protein